MSIDNFVGTWELLSYEGRAPDGSVTHPLGEHPFGVGIYTADGQMSAHLMRAERTPFGGGRRPGVDVIAPDLIVAAAAGYIGYCGRYSVDADRRVVSHFVESALIPDWVGTVMPREYAFSGDQLILRPPPRGGLVTELRWRRRTA
ncbi:MAG: lipocalin-like domain-containing protein [Pseudomonadota bacterium]|uniref:lipocalin-like domain-containing protein n=1 Tax=Phenylobacterium sp. TaxID=1871053 RepID=UPI0025F33C0D|nr:lipocalin-like domain-containing protein [Phenylobacterium sp.]MBT9471685.1 lipocalin-like domain-containing protein [Phenylobacterium sp.]